MTVATEVIHMDPYSTLVRSVVARCWRRYQQYVDFEDLVQEAAVWWYGKGQKYLPSYLQDETLARISMSVYRYVDAYARAEKAARVGYQPRDQYPYNPREVLSLIPIALDPEGLPEPGHPEGPKPKGNLAEGGDLIAALVDVRRALDALSEDDLHFLVLVDDCQGNWDRVAVRLDATVEADSLRRRHARIAERMARWLSNTDHQEDL